MNTKRLVFLFMVAGALSILAIGNESCKSLGKNQNVPKVVSQNCGGCHLVPEAESLTAELWETTVLPRMSEFFVWDERSSYPYANKGMVNPNRVTGMTDENWAKILSYYVSNGLTSPIIREEMDLPLQESFVEETFQITSSPALVTAISIGDEMHVAFNKYLLTISDSLTVTSQLNTEKDITHIYESSGDSIFIVNSGPIDPHEGAFGEIGLYNRDDNTIASLIKGLRRPVQMLKDHDDIYVGQFGFYSGAFTKHNLEISDSVESIHNLPGTYRIKKMRLSKNGEPSLVISLSQGQEGVFAVEKDGKSYILKALLRFVPENGLSDLDIQDVNGDGLDDLLVAHGDNADYSPMPKAYHGVDVYLNKGNYKFEKAYHFPLYGATQARFIDVNGDQLTDIITSAYFGVHNSERIVVLLQEESENEMMFKPHRFNLSNSGRWMVLETGDIDNDGDEDVLIGSYMGGPMRNEEIDQDRAADILVLRNLNKKG